MLSDLVKLIEKSIGRHRKASNEQVLTIILIMWVKNRQFVFTGSTNIIETIKNTDELLNMKGILLENKQTGVIISSSQ